MMEKAKQCWCDQYFDVLQRITRARPFRKSSSTQVTNRIERLIDECDSERSILRRRKGVSGLLSGPMKAEITLPDKLLKLSFTHLYDHLMVTLAALQAYKAVRETKFQLEFQTKDTGRQRTYA